MTMLFWTSLTWCTRVHSLKHLQTEPTTSAGWLQTCKSLPLVFPHVRRTLRSWSCRPCKIQTIPARGCTHRRLFCAISDARSRRMFQDQVVITQSAARNMCLHWPHDKISASQTKMPASPSFFQGATIAKYRPHLLYTAAKNGSTAADLGWSTTQAPCVFSSHAFWATMESFSAQFAFPLTFYRCSLSSPQNLFFPLVLVQF